MKPTTTNDENKSIKSVHIISLGCARNMVDSEVMAGLLNRDGYNLTPQADQADLIVVNTCGFIADAKQESIDTILEAAEFKNPEKGRCQKLVIAGCLAERYPGELRKSLPEVDLVMGTAGFSKIIEEVEKLKIKGSSGPKVEVKQERLKDYDLPRVNSQPFYTAYLKLAEGCAKRCSFCIIPTLRGPLRSRSIATLVKETNDLVAGGVTELNLIAQDLTDYGRDRKDGATLAGLLRELVKIEKLRWIRLFYAYPDQLSDEVFELIRTEPKICKYLDVPVQHINDEVLERMNRKGSGDQIRAMLRRLKREIPDIVLRTSLMVGFPGETEEQFQDLIDFVEEGLLDQVGVFTYSHEEGTASGEKFADDVPAEVKERRRAELYAAQQRIGQEKLKAWMGREIDVLVEGFHEDTDLLLKGRHYGQAPGIDNLTLINDGHAEIGSYVRVRLDDIAGVDVVGGITSPTA
ncbi:MAG: 30S ribosomal protein S12 methylthiotransferase RimO [Bdellovibrionales bacterium]|nr:30S ribosomal protein S12 methylthiotransferase RimO [Bdellovibrionales bacterium]